MKKIVEIPGESQFAVGGQPDIKVNSKPPRDAKQINEEFKEKNSPGASYFQPTPQEELKELQSLRGSV